MRVYKQWISLLLVLLIAAPGSTSAAVEQVTVSVDGLACPFCAYNIEKRINTLEGFDRKANFEVSIAKGLAEFAWKPGVLFDPMAVRDQVRQAGFTPRLIKITVAGTVSKEDGKYFLLLPKPANQRFYLYEAKALKTLGGQDLHKHEGLAAAMTDAYRKRLDQAIDSNKTVRIVGMVHSHKDKATPLAIGVEDLEFVSSVDEESSNSL